MNHAGNPVAAERRAQWRRKERRENPARVGFILVDKMYQRDPRFRQSLLPPGINHWNSIASSIRERLAASLRR